MFISACSPPQLRVAVHQQVEKGNGTQSNHQGGKMHINTASTAERAKQHSNHIRVRISLNQQP